MDNLNTDKKIFFISNYIADNEYVAFAKLFKKSTYVFKTNSPLQDLLYLTSQDYFYENIEEPEFMIYVYSNSSIVSLNSHKISPSSPEFIPKYNYVNGKLILDKPKFFDSFYTVANFQCRYNDIYHNVSDDFIRSFLIEIHDNIRNHWKNTKLIIIDYYYPSENNTRDFLFENPIIKKYYKIIEIQDLFKEEVDLDKLSSVNIVLPKIREILGNDNK